MNSVRAAMERAMAMYNRAVFLCSRRGGRRLFFCPPFLNAPAGISA